MSTAIGSGYSSGPIRVRCQLHLDVQCPVLVLSIPKPDSANEILNMHFNVLKKSAQLLSNNPAELHAA